MRGHIQTMGTFDPLPLCGHFYLLNKALVLKWPFGKTSLSPLNCPRGLCMALKECIDLSNDFSLALKIYHFDGGHGAGHNQLRILDFDRFYFLENAIKAF